VLFLDYLSEYQCIKYNIILLILKFFIKRNAKDVDNQPLLDDELYKERFSVERKQNIFKQLHSWNLKISRSLLEEKATCFCR